MTTFNNSFSEEVWASNYKLDNENTIDDTFRRVAKAVASVEKTPELQLEYENKFYDLLGDFKTICGGRILANAGSPWKSTSLINCFDESAMVFTDKGFKKISNIKIGDLVLTHTGTFKKVYNTLKRAYSGQAFVFSSKFIPNNFISTPEHPFYQPDKTWKNADDTQYLRLMNFNLDESFRIDLASFFEEKIKNCDVIVEDGKIYTFNDIKNSAKINRFIEISDEFLYFLGRFIGDGSVFKNNNKDKFEKNGFNLVFSDKEKEIAFKIKDDLERIFGIEINVNYSKTKTFFYLRKHSTIISTFLYYLCGCGFGNKRIPELIYKLNSNQKRKFLLGLIDSDGYFSDRGDLVITLNNEKLINDLYALFLSIGIPMIKGSQKTVYKGKPRPTPKISCYNKWCLNELCKSSQKIYLDDRLKKQYPLEESEKFKKFSLTDDRSIVLSLKNKSFSKKSINFDGFVYNLSVEEDESFTINGVIVHNCFTGFRPKTNSDSLVGILEVLKTQALTLKSEGGWGLNFSFIRPRGSYIRGVGVESPGAVKYIEFFDKSSDIITSGSGKEKKRDNSKKKIRKGACLSVLSCWHPDIYEYISAKRQEGRLTKFNISVGCNEEFMDKVVKIHELIKNNTKEESIEFIEANKWELIFPDTNFEKYNAEWDGNIDIWKSKNYPVIVYQTTTVKELWDFIMASTYNYNDPGVLFLDRANRTYLLNYSGRKIQECNACCFATSSCVWIITKAGYKEIKQITDKDEIWVDTEKKFVKTKGYFKAGFADVYEVVFGNKTKLYITINHKLMSWSNKNGSKLVELKNLKVGDYVHINLFDPITHIETYEDYLNKPVVSIKSITYRSREEVGCIEVPKYHQFTANGIISGNSEQTMPEKSCCNLFSINLTQFIQNSDKVDYKELEKIARLAIRFADNVNDLTTVPLPDYEENLKNDRRIGIGILGWGSLLYMLKIRFASKEASELKEKIMSTICYSIIDESTNLAKEKGSFVGCDNEKLANHYYFNQINLPGAIRSKIKQYGLRNSSLFSIQPTGNTSILANLVSGGCEPVFMPEYIRTVIVPTIPEELKDKCPKFWEGEFKETDLFKFTKEGEDTLLAAELNGIKYKIDKNRGLTKEVICRDYGVYWLNFGGGFDSKANYAVTANTLTPEEHIKDLTEFTKWLDASASRTVNLPSNYPFDGFKDIYLNAYKSGTIKGITTYRDGTRMSVLAGLNKDKEESLVIKQFKALKRPKVLKANIHHCRYDKTQYYVAVGLDSEGNPYEVFTGINKEQDGNFIPILITEGKIKKCCKDKYVFISSKTEKEYNLTNGHNNDEFDSVTRLLSISLRQGTPIEEICDQLEKSKGSIISFSKTVSRVLKRYIKDGTAAGECPNCGGRMVRKEGCRTCLDCAHSQCG